MKPPRPGEVRPRLGVLATHVIQYHAPLYQQLSRRALVDLEVAILSQHGVRPFRDPDFGITVAWDVDLLSGYRSTLLECGSRGDRARWIFALSAWLRRQDIVVLHGHANPQMLLATALCRALRVPYLLRGESPPETSATGWRCLARHILASFTVSGAAGALTIGQRNAAFYDRYGNVPQFRAPYSVDNDRFRAVSETMRPERAERLTSLGLDPCRPTAIFSGKLTPRKRPLDAVHAIARCDGEINLLILGDGPLRAQVRHFEGELPVRCLGFVNQADLPGWYASGDILVLPSEKETWGVVVNEGMACGLVPVVSEAVGCGPDLVDGVGEIVPVRNIGELADALLRVSHDLGTRRDRTQRRLERYALVETARGYEQAALELHRSHARA
jgi:glycosyltransferase involved in cell wall biosynthesis